MFSDAHPLVLVSYFDLHAQATPTLSPGAQLTILLLIQLVIVSADFFLIFASLAHPTSPSLFHRLPFTGNHLKWQGRVLWTMYSVTSSCWHWWPCCLNEGQKQGLWTKLNIHLAGKPLFHPPVPPNSWSKGWRWRQSRSRRNPVLQWTVGSIVLFLPTQEFIAQL